MPALADLPPIFGTPAPLPRGPHGLPREEVAAAQRARLLSAVVTVVAEKGYAATTISEITRLAGVSPNVFYAHFVDREACYLAAYEVFAATLLQRIAGALDADAELEDFITVVLRAYLSTLDSEPVVARGFLLEMDGAGPVARKQRYAAYAAIATSVKEHHHELCRRSPTLRPLPDIAYIGIVHGVRELVCDALEGRIEGRVTDLLPEIVVWITATFQGATSTAASA